MELIKLTLDNLENEHICCAIANNNDCQVSSKKAWLKERLSEGLVFIKGDVRGKCFIEYIPAEFAWVPINADNYNYINCLWVSGSLKGKGYSNLLLNECIADSKNKGKSGIAILTSPKKMGFLADKKYLEYKGFLVADNANPYFTLMYLPFNENSSKPCFNKNVKNAENCKNNNDGYTIYYTNQCPYTEKYVPLLEAVAKNKGEKINVIKINSLEAAKSLKIPFTTFCLTYNGKFITHEIQSEAKFEKLINENNK